MQGAQGRSGSRHNTVACHRGGTEARLARSWIREHEALLCYKTRCPAGTECGGVSIAGGRQAKAQRRVEGWGAVRRLLAITAMFDLEFAYLFRVSVSMKEVAGENLFYVPIYMNFYVFLIYFILVHF